MTKERIIKELSKVRRQLADLQERQKDLESQLQMAEEQSQRGRNLKPAPQKRAGGTADTANPKGGRKP